ncbi:hypothetical protein PAEPH01_0239 [Pancytospora epiphaga]|nr:hypothetical protein PAEPH01_0239 [Pancytospora epiphaga]
MERSITHFHTYKTHTKLRWKDRGIVEVLVAEFRTRKYEYYIEAIQKGVITVNGRIVSPNYKLKDLDVIQHTVHFHEPISPPIKIIKKEEEYIVVNKPAGIPVHPTGGYLHYSITKTLFPDTEVGCVNRLDMPVSGVLILTLKNRVNSYDLLKSAEKIYIAKTRGFFPETAVVDEPIGTRDGRIHEIMKNGKASKTLFERIAYKNGISLVKCQPITGRTHQIRIHIKHLGFPIINDILYGEKETMLESTDPCLYEPCREDPNNFLEKEKYECIIKHCTGENNRSFHVVNSFICLHAWKYKYNNTVYEAEWPEWANLDYLE